MRLSVAIAGAIFLLASLTACIGDRSGEAVNKFIEDAKEGRTWNAHATVEGRSGSAGSQCASGFFRRHSTKD